MQGVDRKTLYMALQDGMVDPQSKEIRKCDRWKHWTLIQGLDEAPDIKNLYFWIEWRKKIQGLGLLCIVDSWDDLAN